MNLSIRNIDERDPETRVFPTWKRVQIGTILNANEAQKKLSAAGIKLTVLAEETLNLLSFPKNHDVFDLVRAKASDFGLPHGTKHSDIYAAANDVGLDLCPPELAPELWVQDANLLVPGERAHLAMKPIPDPYVEDVEHSFRLLHDSQGKWLDVEDGSLDDHCLDSIPRIFIRKR